MKPSVFERVVTGDLTAPRLAGRLVERSGLDACSREAMFRLLAAHFVGVDRQTFDADLSGKTAVILLEDETGTLRGFSTLLVYPTIASGRPMTIVYSGDTIVDRTAWGSPVLARTWIHSVRQLVPADAAEVYWLLLTSGFRTYRFLPAFYRSFYPRFDAPAPPDVQSTVDAVAVERFGDRYDRAAGIVRFARPQVLAGDLVDVPSGRALDRHVRYFLERNPGFVRGDELVCFTRIHFDNLTAAAKRMARPDGRDGAPCR